MAESSQIFVCLLRGINVSGQKNIKMDALRKMFEELGYLDVCTYVQSGNVVFRTREKSTDRLVKFIQKEIKRKFGFEVSVLIRSSKEIKKVIMNNPFARNKRLESSRLYVTFLCSKVSVATAKKLEKLRSDGDQFIVRGDIIYLACANGYGKTKLSNNAFEKLLSLTASTRNWNTVQKLLELCAN